MKDYGNLPSLQGQVEEYLGDICLDGEQSVPLNGSNTQQAYCAPDKMMGFSRLSRFGMMFKPLTESLGEELLMSYLGDFPVKTYQQPGGGDGLEGERSGMWKEMARIIGEVRPQYAFVENSPMLTIRGLGTVLADLASMGFDAEWCVLGADDIGACHHRERIWILANSNSNRLESNRKIGSVEKTRKQFRIWRSEQANVSLLSAYEHENACKSVRDDDVVAARVDRLKAIGNGQVPQVAGIAWELLKERLNE